MTCSYISGLDISLKSLIKRDIFGKSPSTLWIGRTNIQYTLSLKQKVWQLSQFCYILISWLLPHGFRYPEWLWKLLYFLFESVSLSTCTLVVSQPTLSQPIFWKCVSLEVFPHPPFSISELCKNNKICINFQNHITVINLLSVIKRGMWTHIIFIHCVFSYEIVVILHAEINSYGHLPDNCQTTIALAWFVQRKSCFWLVVVTVGNMKLNLQVS